MLNPVFSGAHMRNLTPVFHKITTKVSSSFWRCRVSFVYIRLFSSSRKLSEGASRMDPRRLTSSNGWVVQRLNSSVRVVSDTPSTHSLPIHKTSSPRPSNPSRTSLERTPSFTRSTAIYYFRNVAHPSPILATCVPSFRSSSSLGPDGSGGSCSTHSLARRCNS